MTRRMLLALFSRIVAAASAVAALVPNVRFLADPLRRREETGPKRYRLARLAELPVGEPTPFVLRGRQVDAWKVYPSRILGQVWVIRDNDATDADHARLRVFSATCPHLGCTVNHDPEKRRFVCPCHAGVFTLDGEPVPSKELGYQNPVPRGMDPLKWSLVEDETGELWLEVEYVRFELGRPERVPVA